MRTDFIAAVPPPKTAIIAVHGVADQKPSETAAQLADLLVALSPDGSNYALESIQEFGLQVLPLDASEEAHQAYSGGRVPLFKGFRKQSNTISAKTPNPPTPQGGRPLGKAFLQSIRSDFHSDAAIAQRQKIRDDLEQASRNVSPRGTGNAPPVLDSGVEFSDYLLAKAKRNEMPPMVYNSKRFRLRRVTADGGAEQIDLYEMYWADLSRLSSAVPRILTELFTLLFRLSLLGRETVATAAHEYRTQSGLFRRSDWAWLSFLQSALDWSFSRLLATFFAQLALIALIIIPVGLAIKYHLVTPGAVGGIGLTVFLGSVALLIYRLRPSSMASYWPFLFLIAACALGLFMVLPVFGKIPKVESALPWLGSLKFPALPVHWVLGLAWLLLLSIAYDAFLKICDVRFPLTRFSGWLAWGLLLVVVIWTVAHPPTLSAKGLIDDHSILLFSVGALRALEFVLIAIAVWWLVTAIMMIAWLLFGVVCGRTNSYESKSTVATGRLGFIVSLGAFMLITLATWALLESALEASFLDLKYAGIWFANPDDCQSAAAFLKARFTNTVESLGLVIVLFTSLVLYLLVGFLPSVLAEIQAGRPDANRLGRWLTRTYRFMDRFVCVVVFAGVTLASLVAIDIFTNQILSGHGNWIHRMYLNLLREAKVESLLGALPLLLQMAGGTTVALAALGGLLSRYVPWLRGPLDAALDVDNHFREFPRQGIPRARIFARYAALLQYLKREGYEHVVIVSHSQGTVITADLMHYLRARSLALNEPKGLNTPPPAAATASELGRWLGEDRVKLLTMGSPLRQLYAARFPVPYRWMLSEVDKSGRPADRRGRSTEATDEDTRLGPSPASIGAKLWWNAYTTGDYIGRWLWTQLPQSKDFVSISQIDRLGHNRNVYRRRASVSNDQTINDVPLGSGAHTHYLDANFALAQSRPKPSIKDLNQTTVAQLVDRLVTT